ncbi:MAG: radical SAM protein [Candidatus Nanoarchaeia archaeon]|nr:radical SAM protein [Candidatus Haiyanarchaeum thermophilum]MCW1303348.1 radical SAM protein [Candidatus Haiyanarchaeum thermophilum]MCW1304070.1 radical SAM protein [Candidatus Haiyanarchaeum thermophilum]MCW1306508.1 radical SAM protein [Candidatus Haiyanarchaeum thermophilum]MCW1308136.1 radical SAM protein [Candidatus Haiyanarchaeum thermophilum]
MPSKLLTSTAITDTISFCMRCKKTTESQILEEDGKVFLEKKCCGERVLIDKDNSFFRIKSAEKNLETPVGLTARELHNLLFHQTTFHLLYVTGKCNLACPICFLKNLSPVGEDPSTEELEKFLKSLRPSIVVFEGAEPTMREDLPLLIRTAKKTGHIVKIFTNGIKLENESYVRELKKAGLDGLYFSIDGFDDRIIQELRGRPLLHTYLKALGNLKKYRMNTTLAITIKKGLNEGEIPKLLNFAIRNRDFIKAAFIGGVWLPTAEGLVPSFTLPEIYDLLANATGISLEYFTELARFRWNLYKLLSILDGENSKFSLLRGETIYFKIKGEKLTPIIEVNELSQINSWIESSLIENKKFNVLRRILSNPLLLFKTVKSLPLRVSSSFILSRFNQVKAYPYHINSGFFRIIIKSLISYSNIDLLRPPAGEKETFHLYPIESTPLPQ